MNTEQEKNITFQKEVGLYTESSRKGLKVCGGKFVVAKINAQ